MTLLGILLKVAEAADKGDMEACEAAMLELENTELTEMGATVESYEEGKKLADHLWDLMCEKHRF